MSADPVTEPLPWPPCDPAELLVTFEKAVAYPIKPEYLEGMVVIPPNPNRNHNADIFEICYQLRAAGIENVGFGDAYTNDAAPEKRSLVGPDFFVLTREPTDLDEAYCKSHKGWYSIDLLALVGEITSTNHETDSGPKLRIYADAGVPVYVLVHRQDGLVHVYSEPDPAGQTYAAHVSYPLGGKVPLPAPYPVLDTAPLLPSS